MPLKLRDDHGRVGVVNLDDRVIRQVMEIAALCRTFIQDELRAAAYHKVLLVNTQKSSLFIAVVRIEEQSETAGDIFFIERDAVLYHALIYGVHIEKMQLVGAVFVPCDFDVVHP